MSFTFGAPYQRYGNPTVVDFNNGVTSGAIVRYLSPYDAVNKVFTQGTPLAPVPITPTGGHACWTMGVPPAGALPYLQAGCEHFGLGLAKNPTATAYHWLIADPANPGQTIQSPTKVTVPAPVANVFPPPVPGGQPVVQQIVPAEPPKAQEFGDAQWVKVFKTEAPDPVNLNHLVTDDPGVPQDPVEVETEWSLLQLDKNAGGGARKEQENHAEMGKGKQSVTRRYEFYKFTGAYDPETHEALPAVSDSSPQPAELGDYEGAQMAAVNVGATPSATATPTATGTGTPKATATATAVATATATVTPTVTLYRPRLQLRYRVSCRRPRLSLISVVRYTEVWILKGR